MLIPDISPGSTAFLVLCLIGYVLFANVMAFTAFWLDKRRAQRGEWRVPERSLLILAVMGGWIGAKLAQHTFRHKTRKQPFRTLLNLSVLVLPALAAAVWVARSDFKLPASVLELAAQLTPDPAQPEKPALPRRFGPGS